MWKVLLFMLDAMASAQGVDYVAARDAVLETQNDTRPKLEQRVASAAWTLESQGRDAMAAIALAWMDFPEEAEHVYHLAGLQPTVYRAWRRPDPAVARELKRMPRGVAPIFAEVLLKTRSLYPTHTPAEQQALVTGLLVALGASEHKMAPAVLLRELEVSPGNVAVERAVAAGLGMHGGPAAFEALAGWAGGDASASRRLAALTGLGYIRTPASQAILKAASKSPDPDISAAAQAALAHAGSAWAAAARQLL